MPSLPQAPSLGDTSTGRGIISVTPSDTVDLPYGTCRAFHVNVAGDVRIHDYYGNDVTLTVVAGMPIPYSAKKIFSTSTTATGIFAIY